MSTDPSEPRAPGPGNGLPDDELSYWLALVRAPGIGPARFAALLGHSGSARRLFEDTGPPLKLDPETLEYLRRPAWAAVETDLRWRDEAPQQRHILVLDDPRYPQRLRQISDPPPVLYVQGDPTALSWPQLAVVGSRNPTTPGERTAREFAAHLAAGGLGITSGLAQGIDAAAHRGALDSDGISVAVLGTGPDRVYPARHRELAHEVGAAGALVSEFPPGAGPRAEHFPRRNRVISGLSVGTLVVEAAMRSGSLITARHALEQGREVFAIPGSIHNPLARGCHALIRQGAKLVETAGDVIEELGGLAPPPCPQAASEAAPEPEAASLEQLQLLEIMGFEPTSIDELVSRSGLTPEAVSSMLLILELRGYVTSCPGGRYARGDKEAPR
ncbi:MAG TPA: DNA-processing protein DprA [Gammaproteobacteria bacterium]|nr:DNA-processing protein DprA [Gammaproteobacteria bacterium]